MPVVGTGQFSPDARYLATVGFGAALTFIRIDRDVDGDGVLDEAGAVDGGPAAIIRWEGRAPATDAAARLVVVAAADFVGGLAVRDLLGPAPPPFDTDADGLANGFESRFGLNAASDAGADGPDGDPDGDGRDQRAGAAGRDASARLPDPVSRRGRHRRLLHDAHRRRQSG